MKNNPIISAFILLLLIATIACTGGTTSKTNSQGQRPLKDTIGFAQYAWQMDSLMSRMYPGGMKKSNEQPLKLAICPHDDYTYVGRLYPELLQNVKAHELILIGVAHKAARLGIMDSLVFDSYNSWKGPWQDVQISPFREAILTKLRGKFAIVNDTLQKVEHSVEAMIPYLQYFNRHIRIVSILVPSMSPDRMEACGKALADAIREAASANNWKIGSDYAIIATTDAVHYGNEDWGGVDMAFYGCDEGGNIKAREHEAVIIDSCLVNTVSPGKIRLFSKYTLKAENFREYKWTWCGRYSVPLALYTGYFLNEATGLSGTLTGYSTSITQSHIPVDDLRMGRTAIATKCHWVGYASLGYR